MIGYIKGDVIKAFENDCKSVLLHQCNLTVGMGGGIAKTIAKSYLNIIEKDLEIRTKAIEKPEYYLGDYLVLPVLNMNAVINVYSQYFPGSPNQGFDTFIQRMHWLESALSKLSYYFIDTDTTFYMPLIASGLAKDTSKKSSCDLDYFEKYIASTVEETLKDFNVKVYYL